MNPASAPQGPPPVAPLQIHTLGRFALQKEGAPLRFEGRGQPMPLELLKVLIACGGTNVPLEHLAESLWPDSEGDAAQNALAATLHRLRRVVGAEALPVRNRALSLDSQHCWVDALAFSASLSRPVDQAGNGTDAAREAQVEQALALYEGPFLPGEFAQPEILAARARLHQAFLQSVEELASGFCARGELERAVALYRRGLAVDEAAEGFCQGLLRCLLEQGRVAEGVSAYRRFSEALVGTLGVEPAAETLQLYEALRSAPAAAAHDPSRVIPADVHRAAQPVEGPATDAAMVPAGSAGARSRRRRWVVAGAATILALLLAAAAGFIYLQRSEEAALANLRREAVLPLPERPSIAVLAFANQSGDPALEYFSDGFSESLITRLSKLFELFVIARSSSFAYKGKAVDPRQIGRELGVRYVLDGSVRKAGGQVRVTAQLVDAATGQALWSRAYDRELQDLFAVMDELTMRVVRSLQVTLTEGRREMLLHKGTENVQAWEASLQGYSYFGRFSLESHIEARRLLHRAVELDPGFAWAYGALGWSYLIDARNGWSADRDAMRLLGAQMVHKALELDGELAEALTARAQLYTYQGDHDRAVADARRATEVEPGNPVVLATAAIILNQSGYPQESVGLLQTAMRLHPHFPTYFPARLAEAYRLLGRHEEAIALLQRTYPPDSTSPELHFAWSLQAASLVGAGRVPEARQLAVELRRRFPDYNGEKFVQSRVYRDQEATTALRLHLTQAGLL